MLVARTYDIGWAPTTLPDQMPPRGGFILAETLVLANLCSAGGAILTISYAGTASTCSTACTASTVIVSTDITASVMPCRVM